MEPSVQARCAAGSFLVGVIGRSMVHMERLNAHYPDAAMMPFVLVALSVMLTVLLGFSTPLHRRLRIVALCALFALIGSMRFDWSLPSDWALPSAPAAYAGIVNTAPVVSKRGISFELRESDHGVRIAVKAPTTAGDLERGSKIQIFCRLSEPTPPRFDPFMGPYRKVFTNEEHAIAAECKTGSVAVLQGSTLFDRLVSVPERIRHSLMGSVQAVLEEPAATVLGSVVFGANENIPTDIVEAFRRTGTLHILVVSGSHFSLLAGLLSSALDSIQIGALARSASIASGLFFFLALIGFPPSAVRGWFASISVLAASTLKRPRSAAHILLLITAAMTIADPWLPLFSLGFQLSVLASLGIISLSGPLDAFICFWQGARYPSIRQAVASTLAALMATVPLLLYAFGSVSPVSLVANIAAVLAAPALLVVGLGFTALTVTVVPIARLIAPVVSFLFQAFVGLIAGFADVPWANIVVGKIPGSVAIMYYACFIVFCWRVSREDSTLRFSQQSDRIRANETL